MKPKDVFGLAVRLLGLVFVYHGLVSVPVLFTGISLVSILTVGWPLLVGYVLLAYADWLADKCYPDAE